MNDTYLRLASIFPFFVPAIRDYIDILNNVYASVSNDINLQQVLQQSFLFVLASIKFTALYFLSFQWIQDITYLPVLIPQLKIEILKEHFFLQTPNSTFFTFLETPSWEKKEFFLNFHFFILGFVNSFFLCLPLSVAHIISTRRLLIQGFYAGVSSSFGTICGQSLLLICIIFGGRFFVVPWFNLQVINYFVGICLVLNLVYDIAHERSIRIIDSRNTFVLVKIFLLNFALAWTEQSCIFQYFGNLTFGAQPTLIESFSSATELQSIGKHLIYITGIIIGSLLFTGIFIFNCRKINDFIVQKTSILYTRWIRRLNFILLTLIITFTFTSIPFYSFDYLVLSNVGFVSQDKGLKDTLFLPTKTHDFSPPLLGDMQNQYIDSKPGVDTDITPFDRGRYLMFDINDSFEQLNYKGEYAWLNKKHKTPTVSRDPSSFSVIQNISKIFNKSQKSSDSTSSISSRKKKIASERLNERIYLDSAETLENSNEENLDISSSRLKPRIENEQKITDFYENLVNMSFSNKSFTTQEIQPSILEKKLKQKYYANPIYKLLLSTDIDFFLSRQPRSFVLSGKHENELFTKRLLLANYYDSLRYYNTLPYAEEFEDTFDGSKSYADRIYNQQFKGTLKIVRRLFSISLHKNDNELNSSQNNNNKENLILKFDQPLYKKSFANNNTFHPIFHEEFRLNKVNELKQSSNKKAKLRSPFVQLVNPIPFYVGWDEQLRKLVITNRLSPRSITGYAMKLPTKTYSTEYPTLNTLIKKSKTIDFTTWPVPKNILQKSNDQSIIPYNFLFESITDSKNKLIKSKFSDQLREGGEDTEKLHQISKTETIPLNIARNVGKNETILENIIPYTRGGFVWPGHSDLQFKFKNLK